MMQSTTSQPGQPDADAIAVLRAQARELQLRIDAAATQRAELAALVAEAGPPANLPPAVGIQMNRINQQIMGLDQQLINMRAELRNVEARIPQEAAVTPVTGPQPGSPVEVIQVPPPASPPLWSSDALVAGLSALVLFPLAIALAWRLIRRTGPGVTRREWNESAERMHRIEQAVDAIAIEVERISEGQRFITRALGDGTPEFSARIPERVRVEREQ